MSLLEVIAIKLIKRMQELRSMSETTLEADAENVMRQFNPVLDPSKYKGQPGEPLKTLIFVSLLLISLCLLFFFYCLYILTLFGKISVWWVW